MQIIFYSKVQAVTSLVPPTNQIPAAISGVTQRLAVAGSGSDFGAPTSIIRIYVPTGTARSQVNVTIKGIDSRLDNLSYMSLQLTSPTDQKCTSLNESKKTNITSISNNYVTAPATGSTSKITQYDSTQKKDVSYDVYCIRVEAGNAYDSPFWLSTSTSGAILGNADDVDTGTGYANDDNPGSSTPWSKVLTFASDSCSVQKSGSITFYDMDINRTWSGTRSDGTTWSIKQGLIPITLTKSKSGSTPVDVPLGSADGALNTTGNTLIKTGNRVTMSVYPTENFQPGWKYTLKISSLVDLNTIRITLPFDQIYGAFSCPNNDPIGVAEVCTYDKLTGITTIKGWAFDYNDGAGPSVNVSLSGVSGAKSDISNRSYDQVRIDTFLTGSGVYGSPGNTPSRDGKYGWLVNFSGLSYGGSYAISGTITNSGAGANQNLLVSTAELVGGKLPATCLPPPDIGCVINNASSVYELGDTKLNPFKINYTVKNNTTGSVTIKVYSSITNKYTESLEIATLTLAANASTTTDSVKSTLFTASADTKDWDVNVILKTNTATPSKISDCPETLKIVRKPFISVTNGDLLVGASSDCSDPLVSGGNLFSWATPLDSTFTSANRKGANSQYVAQVFGEVKDFYSAGGISKDNKKYLTLANSNASDIWGGKFGVSACLKDVYTNTKRDDAKIMPFNSTFLYTVFNPADPANPSQVEFGSEANPAKIAIKGITNFTGNIAVYVTGDVFIGNDGVGGPANFTLSPGSFFALIVKGNIYIDFRATTIEGMLIAQDNSNGGGIIYTCGLYYGDFYNMPIDSMYTNCNNKLNVNGIVQAKEIKLHRTFGSLNGVDPSNAPAEVFNGRPELYFVPNPFSNPTNPGTAVDTRYDSITNLPPLL